MEGYSISSLCTGRTGETFLTPIENGCVALVLGGILASRPTKAALFPLFGCRVSVSLKTSEEREAFFLCSVAICGGEEENDRAVRYLYGENSLPSSFIRSSSSSWGLTASFIQSFFSFLLKKRSLQPLELSIWFFSSWPSHDYCFTSLVCQLFRA